MFRVRFLAVSGAVVAAACSEAPITTPTASMSVSSASSSVVADAGTYLVAFKGGVPADFTSTVESLGGSVLWTHDGVRLGAISGISSAAASALSSRSDVAAFEPDAYTLVERPLSVSQLEVATLASASNPAGAIIYSLQWNMRAIHADAAWAAGKLGNPSTRVGILDTGIGYNFPDFVGLVDLGLSKSFLSDEENARVTSTFGASTNLVADLHYHGTHVAATVASTALVTAGVTSQVRLVGIKVCTPGTEANAFLDANCPASSVLGGVLYAADAGLDVINLSLGSEFLRRDARARKGISPSFIAIMNSVFNYAHQKGTLAVVAAGNEAIDLDHSGNLASAYCDAPHVVCVSATGPAVSVTQNVDAPAFYTNFGRSAITVAAPGGNGSFDANGNLVTLNAVWSDCSPFSIVLPSCRRLSVIGLVGTSMAAPHVTGVAALIAGEVGHDPDAIVARLTGSADDLGLPGTDPFYGKGRVNAAHAMGVNY